MKITIIAIAISLCSIAINAQVSLILEDQQVEKEEIFTVDVKAENFQSLLSMQFMMNWDQSVLRLIGVENYGLSDLTDRQFGLSEDQLIVMWIDLALEGITVADSSTLFSVKFKALAAKDSSMVVISGTQETPIEFIDVNENEVEVVPDTSFITVLGATPTRNIGELPVKLHPNQPNPFSYSTQIPVDANYPQQVELRLFNQEGIHIKTIEVQLSEGKNFIELKNTIFPASGIYYYQLLTENYAKTEKLEVLH
ncbi:MAG: T9SS type A sorting domain-containing protein [Bacteroidota bacterium]